MGLVLSAECAVIRLIRCASFKPLECSCTGPYAELNVGRFFSRKSGPF